MPKIRSLFLSAKEAAQMMGCIPRHVRTMISKGQLAATKVQGPDGACRYQISLGEVDRVRYQAPGPGRPRGSRSKETSLGFPRKGQYVYGWYTQREDQLPFYVGAGSNDRAIERHCNCGVEDICQKVREKSPGFTVRIYAQGLDDKTAFLLETTLIRTFSDLGGCSCNRAKRIPFKLITPK